MADRSELKIVLDGLGNLKKNLRSRAGIEVRKAALAVEAEAKTLAPVDTGALRNSIQAEKHPSQAFTWQVKVGMEYGAFVEYGTVNAPAQPFLTPAVEHIRPQLKANLAKMMDDPLEGANDADA